MDILFGHGRVSGIGPNSERIENWDNIGFQLVTHVTRFTISSAQLLALNATPISVVPAPGAGLILVPILWGVTKAAGTAYAGVAAGEDLVLKFTDGSGVVAATPIETTGFLDQTTLQTRYANGHATGDSATPAPALGTAQANAALVLQLLTGEITTGTSGLIGIVQYRIVPASIA